MATEEKKDGVLIPEKQLDVARALNTNVLAVIGNDALMGFEKAYQIANATLELKKLLTPEYMKPIMHLQGNKLGFKTDKDDEGGYKEDVVKNCLIEAVLTGVQPFGNQFNIIAGSMYVTKEGFGYLLRNKKYKIIPGLPRIKDDKSGAAVLVTIKWMEGSEWKEEQMDIPIRMNKFMGTDAVLGKATRKARAWLFNNIHGTEVGDGDATDITAEVMSSKIENSEKKASDVAAGVKGLMPKKEEKNAPKNEGDPSKLTPEEEAQYKNTKTDEKGQTSLM